MAPSSNAARRLRTNMPIATGISTIAKTSTTFLNCTWSLRGARTLCPIGGIPVEYKGGTIPPPDQRRSYN